MKTTAIEVRNLSVTIDRQEILKKINVRIPARQVTAVLGPSGCGKTTFLKSLNRLNEISERTRTTGEILFDGKDILNAGIDVYTLRQRIGLLSQKPCPLPMNIFDNVAYGMKISGNRDSKSLRKKVQFYLEQAGVWEEVKNRLKEPANRLSLGQQQRLCLARGLAVNPEIIMADEPTSALDPISGQAIEKKFTELKKDYTIILVTHILRQARRLADHVIFIYLGEVIEQGPAEEFFSNPKEERTISYLKGLFN